MSLRENGNLPRLLVIGARGFLGCFVSHRGSSCYEVVKADRTHAGYETDVVIDVADAASVRAGIDSVRPDAVALLAAVSDIDRCQREPGLAVAVNVHGAEEVASACARIGARLLFTSTGAVFDGRKHGYSEEDAVSPLSVYGETKAQAEKVVRALVPSALVLRVPLVLGRSGRAGSNSLLDSMMRRWSAGEVVSASTLESRNPVDAGTLSQWMLELLTDECNRGIFHAGATDTMTRYDIVRAYADCLHIPEQLMRAEREQPPGRAPRGLHHLLLTSKISAVCATPVPSCKEVIERSLNEVAEGSL
ncbi:MAG: dTDP-4-dehydrorhamnose reductase [Edaphobacter sp.]|nr:dTDP-4-dehydrorhamnose reductase [Edaphobacter sp.]